MEITSVGFHNSCYFKYNNLLSPKYCNAVYYKTTELGVARVRACDSCFILFN